MDSVSKAKRTYDLGIQKFHDYLAQRRRLSWAEAMGLLGEAEGSGQLVQHEALDANYKMGLLWLFRLDYATAVWYFERCLSIDPGAHFVHMAMGAACLQLEEYEKSAWHYQRLVATGTDVAIACVGVGRALLAAGNPREAIQWFTKDSSWRQHADALLWKGNAHRRVDEADLAFECYEAILALNEADPDALQALAETCLEDKADLTAALRWLDRTYALPESTMARKLCRIRTPFAGYFCDRFPRVETRVAAFEALWALRCAVVEMKENLCCEDQGAAVHYTAIDTSKALVVERSPLRAHRADKMDDPREGAVLRLVLGEDFDEELLGNGIEESASAFVASFVLRPVTQARGTRADDNLLHWRLYGKSGDAEGSGACLVYPSTLFSTKPESHETASLYHSDGIFGGPAVLRNVRRWQQRTPRLYRVVYEGAGAEEAVAAIRPHLRHIGALARTFATEEEKTGLASCARALLEEIRFLFKSRDFEYEEETRVVVMVWPHDQGIETNTSTGIEYVELAGEVYPSEVVLGPCAESNPFAEADALGLGVEIRESTVPYGQS